jgi:hypothetical protein
MVTAVEAAVALGRYCKNYVNEYSIDCGTERDRYGWRLVLIAFDSSSA